MTRKAPFTVYDALRPAEDELPEGRAALYLCAEASAQTLPGVYTGTLLWGSEAAVPVRCEVSAIEIPPPGRDSVKMLNFFDYDNLAVQHGAAKGGEAYWALFRRYVRAQLDMRCTHILLPAGRPCSRTGY